MKSRAADKIDLAVALAMAVGVLQDIERESLREQESEGDWELASIHDLPGFQPTYLSPDDPWPEECFGPDFQDDYELSLSLASDPSWND